MNKTETKKQRPGRTPPERIITHRGISFSIREWADFTGKSKSSLLSLERRGYLGEQLDYILRLKGILP